MAERYSKRHADRQAMNTAIELQEKYSSEVESCSGDFKQLVLQYGLSQSMSRAGNCWDNAVAESFFHTLKTHIIHGCDYKTREDANKALFEYIEIYYNRVRRHSTNGWISPEQYEKQYYLNNTFIEASTV